MEGDTAYDTWPTLDLDGKIAFLQKQANRQDVVLPEDVARYVAKNFRSNASGLRAALIGLIAYSSLNRTPVTLDYTKHLLRKVVDWQVNKGTIDPLQEVSSARDKKQQATSPREPLTEVDCSVILGMKKTHETQKITQARHKFEVNMREFERERLARLDVYERAFEIRIRKQRRG
jgi:Bacterial dnaA  protein